MARWLEDTYVCDREGKRYLPEWLPEEAVTKEQRVKVTWNWLQNWYRTLDAVYAKKKEIEKRIYLRIMDLAQAKVDVVFYDITTIYFERRSPVGQLRRHGMSKDGKPRNVQVLLGTVMLHGLPIATHAFEGNRSEKKTVTEVVRDIRNRFGIRNIIFVADAGMRSPENVELFQELDGYSYILGHPGRRDEDAARWFKNVAEKWEDCGRGTRVQEVESGKAGIRVFVAESDERREYEEALRKKSMARAEKHLEKVADAVRNGRLKDPAKIGARAARALSRDKGYRYFTYEVPGEGEFRYFLDQKKLSAEMLHEGRYLITTDHPYIPASDALRNYKDLCDVEDGYRHLKDVIEGRPVHHKTDDRVAAHLFIASLALLAMRYLRKRLEEAGLPFSPHDALKAAKSLGVATLDLNGAQKVLAAGAKRDANRVFHALNIKDLQPPGWSDKPESRTTLFEM
jgi:transposase